MNMKKRMLVLLLAVVMLVGMLPTAFAADLTVGTNTADVVGGAGNSVVTVDAEPVQMTVTVPSVLPASINTQGNVTVATDAEIRNQSYGPVTVSAIKAEGLNGWSLAGADYSFAKAKVGTKAVQVAIDNAVANAATGAIVVPDKWIISGGDSYGFGYGLKIPAQKVAIPSAQPAKIVFTVDWYEGGNGQASDPETRSSLSLDKEYITMYPETAETIHATAVTETMVAMLSARESDDVTWETTNNAVAEVSGGKVTAREIGRTTVSASYRGLTATCVVDVREAPIPLEAIGFSKDVVNLAKGENETVLLTYNPDKFTGAADVTFTSSNPAISVQPSALTGVTAEAGPTPVTVSATGAGEAIITASATIDGKTVADTMRVVVSVPLESLTIAGETSVVEGETITLTATKNPSNTTDTNKITWSSSDESIATVDENGVVTGVAEGEVVITAKCGGVSANWSVAVESGIEWEYTTDDATNTIALTKYIGESNDVVVKNEYKIGGKTYKNVALRTSSRYSGPFVGSAKKTAITSVVLEDGVQLPSNASYMFYGCSALASVNAEDWDTSAVTNTNSMFSGCASLTALDLNNWNTAAVTDMGSMFSGCNVLTTLDLSSWNTAKVTNMSYMFNRCRALTTVGDLSSWNTAAVTKMSDMFSGCNVLTTLDLSSWNTAAVTSMGNMFRDCNALTTVGDLSSWDTAKVISMSYMFYGCGALTTVGDLSGWNTALVADMSWMFNGCEALTAVGDLNNWNTAKVTDMGNMFYGCGALTTVGDLSGWNTALVADMSKMFRGCKALAAMGNIGGWDTTKVTNMSDMFYDCNALTTVGDLSGWNTAAVTNMSYMFYNCKALTVLDLSGWDTAKVTVMNQMFYNCNALTTLDLSGWNTAKVKDMSAMFCYCYALPTIHASPSFVTTVVTKSSSMFNSCTSLVGGNGTRYSPSHTDATYARIDTASTPGYFTAK